MILTGIGKLSDQFEVIDNTLTITSESMVDIVTRSLEGVVYETTLMYWRAPVACTIDSVSMSLSSNPSATGSYCKVQVMKNGTLETNSIFTADTPMQNHLHSGKLNRLTNRLLKMPDSSRKVSMKHDQQYSLHLKQPNSMNS